MPRLAIRRHPVVAEPPPPGRSLSFVAIWRWAEPALALAVAPGLVLWLENSSLWSTLRSALQSLDFDPNRATLILAWLAAVAVAALATLVTGRPWISVLSASAFTGLTYAWPFGERVRQEVPGIFGLKETLQPAVLWHNQAVALGVTLVAAVMAAATADLVRRGTLGMGRTAWLVARSRPLQREQIFALAGALAIGLTLATGLVLAAGVDPVLRYGPDHGVYLAPVVPSAPPVAADPSQPGVTPEPVPAHGQVLDKVYHSVAMGEDRHFLIYLPPSYDLRSASRRHYPVLYLLHGDPGGPTDWIQFGATGVFDTGIRAGVVPETIVVFPDGNGHVTASTQWANRFDGRDRIEDAVLELVSEVDLDYRTVPDAGHRLIGGLSSGAFGATNIAARHPNIFGIAMSFSGYFVARGPVFGGDSNYIRSNSPYYIVQDVPASRTVRYILVVGNRDPVYQQTNRNFAAVLSQVGAPYDLNVLAGGHSSDIWQSGLALGMTRMAEKLSIPIHVTNDRTRLRPL
jgi:enterochelin esterase-like enzyme